MNISSRKEAAALVVTVTGRMDAATAPEFEKSVSEFVAKGDTALLINLSGLEYVSSAGLRSILVCAKRVKKQNGKLVFSGINGHVREVFTISGFLGIFKIYDSDADGLSAI